MEESCLNSSWLYPFYFYSQSLLLRYKKAGTADSKESCRSAITKSKPSGRKKPSYFLFLSSCALAIAALLAMQNETKDLQRERLLLSGWKESSRPDCSGSGLFEIDAGAESTEVYISETSTLASKLPLPEAPYSCHKIQSPSLISEIL